MRHIWILNHYATYGYGRHYKLAQHLAMKGYRVTIFAASTQHGTGRNLILGRENYRVIDDGSVKCVFVKARDYSTNGWDRLGNMIDYALRVITASRVFGIEKPNVLYASSVHPLTWLSGYFIAKRLNARFIAETRDLWPQTLVDMGRLRKDSIMARLLYMLERFIYSRADRLVFTMPGGIDYVAALGLDHSKSVLH